MIATTSDSNRQGVKQSNKWKISRDTHGDILKKKKDNNRIRIAFQNINGLMIEDETVDKRELIKEFINKYKIEFFGIAEVNVNWKLVKRVESIESMSKEWFENSRTVTSHNTFTRTKTRYQPGGVALIAAGDLSLKVQKCTKDPRSMGRWCSMPVQGKNGTIIRIMSVYVTNPPSNKKDHGNKKVFSQQKAALLQQKSTQSVIEAYWSDFWREIDSYLEAGEKLVICGDWNNDLQDPEFLKPFQDRQLIPATTSLHSNAPATFSNGSYPIDDIFVSSSLDVTACGFLEHGLNNGDHRPVWLELDKVDAMGSLMPSVERYETRRLKLNDPRIIAKYNSILEEQFEKMNIYQRCLNLYNSMGNTLTNEQCIEYDLLDRYREKAMKIAEKKCRKLHSGSLPWSPKLQKTRDIKLYIRLTIRRKKGHKVGARYLTRLSKKAGKQLAHLSLDELGIELQEATKIYKEIKLEAVDHRISFLDSLAEAKEKNGEGTKANIISNIKRTEEQRTSYRSLRRLKKKFQQNLATTSVMLTMPNGSTVELTDKDEMVTAIIHENRKKYHQSEDTCPFLQRPLRDEFGPYGATDNLEKVLRGEYECPPGTDEFTQLFIAVCKEKDIRTQMKRSPTTFKTSWTKMREKTGTHDLHFGHFMSSCSHQHNLLVHYIMAEVPFRTGFSPTRWKCATNVMILKKAGVFDIEKLRTLCLFQSDYNHNNKFLGRKMMDHIVENNYVAREQYSVSGKRCISQALNKTLIFDINRLQKGCLFLTSCDLKSCYDRIAHAAAMLACKSLGVPTEPLISFFSTLQDVKYQTQTVYGKSEATFGGTEAGFTNKPQGAGQGNGAAAQMWTVVSTKMFEMLHSLGLANSISTPISGQDLVLIGFAYVDDSDLFAYSTEQDRHATAKKMQRIIDSWEKSAKVTGGAIAPSKCWWYMLDFEWDENCEWRYVPLEGNSEITMHVNDHQGNREKLQCLGPTEAKEMLGIHLSPDGSNDVQVSKMLQKAHKAAEMIRTSNVQPHEVWLGLTTMTMKALEYPLSATTLSEKQCNTIMRPILNAFLPKAQLNRHFPFAVLYGTISSQGMGLKSLYLTQGITHVLDIMEQVWKGSTTGQFLTISLEYLRLELGLNDDILSLNYHDYSHLIITPTWMTNTWQFLSTHNICIDYKVPTINPVREGDTPLMRILIDSKTLTTKELQTANKCRMFLHIFLLSDMMTGNGLEISYNTWNGIADYINRSSSITWPNIAEPSSSMWETWREILTKTLCTIQVKKLDKPLAKWYIVPDNWTFFLHQLDDNLYSKNNKNQYFVHEQLNLSKRRRLFSPNAHYINSIDTKLLAPTTIYSVNNIIHHEGKASMSTDSQPSTLANQHSYKQWLFPHLDKYVSPDTIIEHINHGTAIAVTDGSYYESHSYGTAAWCIASPSFQILTEGKSIVPGIASIHNSFRSEIVGILAILTVLDTFDKTQLAPSASIEIICDNEKALHVFSNWSCDKMTPKHKNADILSALLRLRDTLPIKFKTTHVYSHQDKEIPEHLLPPKVQLNIKMDRIAKSYALQLINTSQPQFSYNRHYAAFLHCQWRNEVILHNAFNELYQHISHEKIQHYWINNRKRVESEDIKSIDYGALHKGMKSLPMNLRKFASKWSSEFLATGKNMTRWNLRHAGYCPFCTKPNENTKHILLCKHFESLQGWNECLATYISFLQKIDTCHHIIFAIHEELTAWRYDRPPDDITHYPPPLNSAITHQRKLGWKNFLEGIISNKWNKVMHNYYAQKNSRRKSSTWAGKLITYSIKFIFHLWEYRNKQLHDTARIHDMEGLPRLQQSIKSELLIGLGLLPASEYSSYFTTTTDILFNKSLDSQKHWFLVVRQARILLDQLHLQHDEFTTSIPLQKWIGLSYKLDDADIMPTLLRSIKSELHTGLADLPSTLFYTSFQTTYNQFLSQPIKHLKSWLQYVRHGRETMDPSHLTHDEFSHDGPFRSWLGL